MAQARKKAQGVRRAKSRQHLSTPYKAKWVPIRVVPHEHTGHKLPYYCTSYAALFFLLIFTTLMVLMTNHYVSAISGNGTIELGGVVKGKPPEIPATIAQPADQKHFKTSQITISGSCLQDKYIEVYRNNIFAGMTLCDSTGNYVMTVSLLPGKNSLIVKTRDILGQYGPNSKTYTIFYDVDQPTSTGRTPLVIYIDPSQFQIGVKDEFILKYSIVGGKSAYAVSINWGDGGPDTLSSKPTASEYSIAHTFSSPGRLTVRLNVIDAAGSTSSIQTLVIVSPSSAGAGTTVGVCQETSRVAASLADLQNKCNASLPSNILDKTVPVVAAAGALTASFWAGEQVIYRQSLRSKFMRMGRH
jgi:hypothetical protein